MVSNPGSGINVVFASGVDFSVSSLFLVIAVWNRQGKLKESLSNRYVLEQKTFSVKLADGYENQVKKKVPIVICHFFLSQGLAKLNVEFCMKAVKFCEP